jgi:hypothetical protein
MAGEVEGEEVLGVELKRCSSLVAHGWGVAPGRRESIGPSMAWGSRGGGEKRPPRRYSPCASSSAQIRMSGRQMSSSTAVSRVSRREARARGIN